MNNERKADRKANGTGFASGGSEDTRLRVKPGGEDGRDGEEEILRGALCRNMMAGGRTRDKLGLQLRRNVRTVRYYQWDEYKREAHLCKREFEHKRTIRKYLEDTGPAAERRGR